MSQLHQLLRAAEQLLRIMTRLESAPPPITKEGAQAVADQIDDYIQDNDLEDD